MKSGVINFYNKLIIVIIDTKFMETKPVILFIFTFFIVRFEHRKEKKEKKSKFQILDLALHYIEFRSFGTKLF